MTGAERYGVILGELAEKLKEKNEIISLQNWQIAGLEAKLNEAEKTIKEKGETK